jgi:apolipoprotein N-acyltransferase
MDKLLFSLIAGLLYPLAFAPWGWWPLVLLSIALFWWSLRDASARQAVLRGWLFGLGSFGFGVSWLHVSMYQYGGTPLWLALPMTGLFAAAMALYPAALAGLSVRLGHRGAVFTGLWLLIDWLRGLLLTGFPWLYPGYAMTDTPISNLAPLGGIWLVSLVTVAAAVTLAELARRRWQAAIPTAALALAGGLISLLPLSFTEQTGEPVRVALAQGNVPQDVRWQLTQQAATRAIYADLTGQASPGTLLIWPEAAITEFYQDARPFLLEQGERMNSRGWRPDYRHPLARIRQHRTAIFQQCHRTRRRSGALPQTEAGTFWRIRSFSGADSRPDSVFRSADVEFFPRSRRTA